jgi:hypothetical protein
VLDVQLDISRPTFFTQISFLLWVVVVF